MVSYWTVIQKLIKTFFLIQFGHVPRAHIKNLDALATLSSMMNVPDKEIGMSIIN